MKRTLATLCFCRLFLLNVPPPSQLLWVILIGLVFALIIQSLSANLGVVTGTQETTSHNMTVLQ
jgi:hypothetical protein